MTHIHTYIRSKKDVGKLFFFFKKKNSLSPPDLYSRSFQIRRPESINKNTPEENQITQWELSQRKAPGRCRGTDHARRGTASRSLTLRGSRWRRDEAIPPGLLAGTAAPGLDKCFYYKHNDMSWAKLSVLKRISHGIVTWQ